jgi:2-hydroxy-3-keto-5-methylthiopentenyl-1-phosphate phosphatase
MMFCQIKTLSAEVSFETGVSVQKEAENSSIAKNEAMKDAYRQALLKVAERLTTKENVDQINTLTDTQLVHFIAETAVVAEKSTKTGYMADLNVKINGELLKEYMLENNMISVVTTPSEVLIIPIFSDTEYDGTVLFEDGNIWRTALLQKGEIKAGSVHMDVIEDTPLMREKLTPDMLIHMSAETYEKLHFLTQAKNIYVVHAVKAGQNTLVLVVKKYNGGEKRILVSAENEDLFEKAITQMVSYIALSQEEKDVTQSAYKSKIKVVFAYKALKEWLSLQQKLNSVSVIKKIETGAMESGRVLFDMDFAGTLENLTDILKENHLTLEFENGNYIIKNEG